MVIVKVAKSREGIKVLTVDIRKISLLSCVS